MGATQVNCKNTGYSAYWHYENLRISGGYVRCEDCKSVKDFVSMGPLESWLELHATPGHMFSCRALAGSEVS